MGYMSRIVLLSKRAMSYAAKHWFVYFALVVYCFFVCYYMGPSVTSCATTVYGFGDNTAGPIWQASLPEKQGLIGSYTSMTNAPYGDNLENPIGYSLVAQSVLIKSITAAAGPVCGYNLANMLGFVLSAMVMFGFVFSITRRRWIALLAGYAASFAPYFQLKIGAHFSFGFQAIFIGIIWAFYNLIHKRRKRDAGILALLLALGIYWDPYYTLLVACVIVPLAATWIFLNRALFTRAFWKARDYARATKKQLRLLLVSAGIAALLIAPLVHIFLSQGKQISTNVAASRGNVLLEAQYCSNWPHEYLVPFMFNPVLEKIFGKEQYNASVNVLRDHYSCGIGEDIVGLSVTLAVIAALGALAMVWEHLNRRRTALNKLVTYEPKILVWGLFAILAVAVAIGFPPIIRGHIPTPSYELIQLTSTWRTLTRVFVIVNITLIALASISMVYLIDKLKLNKKKYLLGMMFVMVFGAVVIEYQTAKTPFSGNSYGTFDYTKSVPSHYQWLKQQTDIKTVAEYPLERSGGEGNSMAYYLSMQVVHGKKLFNGSLGFTVDEKKKTGLKNLYDPQTIPVLKAMGVDAIIVHGITKDEALHLPYGKIIHSSQPNGFTVVGFSPLVQQDDTYVISLKDVSQQQAYILAPQEGFYRNMSYVKSAVDWQYLGGSKSVIEIVSLNGAQDVAPREVCMAVRTVSAEASILKIYTGDTLVSEVALTNTSAPVSFSATGHIRLQSSTPDGIVVSKLGCIQ